MKRVVVTGASGFIGKAVCGKLELAGAEVLRVPSSEVPRWASMPDAVCVHLAANNDVAQLESRYELRRDEAAALARQVLEKGFQRIVFASSALVYGDAEETPRTEDSPFKPTTAYGHLKAELEGMFSGPNCACARISNVYGSGMSSKNVFSDILRQLRAGGLVKVRNLTSVRDYIHVDDVADALTALALGAEAGAFNVSTGRGVGVRELASLAARAHGKENVRIEAAEELSTASNLVLDPGRLAAACGWRARIRLEEGVAALAEATAR